MTDDDLSNKELLNRIKLALDSVQADWDNNLIAGSRPAHMYSAILITANEWYHDYINSMKNSIEHMKDNQA